MAAFREMLNAEFHERVAREHLEDGMPVIELHRNHGIPLSAVKKWIELFRTGGREAIREAAATLTRTQRKPLAGAALEKLRARLRDGDIDTIITVGVRRVHALADEIEALATQRRTAIEALLTLGDLGAFDRLDRAAVVLGDSYRSWVAGARERA